LVVVLLEAREREVSLREFGIVVCARTGKTHLLIWRAIIADHDLAVATPVVDARASVTALALHHYAIAAMLRALAAAALKA
jgi:hypothetical protein